MTIDLKELFNLNSDLDERTISVILKAFKEAVDQNKTFDYLRFKQSVESLMKMNMDETTSIKSTFATASTMGMTKEEISSSAGRFITILKKEREKFIEALKHQIEVNIEKPNGRIQEFTLKIEENKRKIQKLADENEAMQTAIIGIQEELKLSQDKIDATKEAFIKVYEAFESEIESDVVKYTQTV